MWPLRSMLFIPAHKADWVHRVDRFGPDSVVLDLEDAVPHHLKVAATAMPRGDRRAEVQGHPGVRSDQQLG